jgi:hypothetical protein
MQTVSILQYILEYFLVKGGVSPADLWPPSVGNSWRTTNDIQDNWASMIGNIDRVSLFNIFRI